MADNTTNISSEALRQATKLLADISQAGDKTSQNALFRYHVELLIDQAERQELDLLDFLSECVMLAGQNMQDVRLQLLEYRMDKAENPAPPSFAEITINMALVLAIELAVIGASYYALPAILAAFMSGPVMARTFRAGWLNRSRRYDVLTKRSSDLDSHIAQLQKTADKLEIKAKEQAKLGRQRSSERYRQDQQQYLATIKESEQEQQEIQRKLQTIQLANGDLQLAKAVVEETAKFKSARWSDYLTTYTSASAPANALIDTAESRFAQDLGTAFKDYVTKTRNKPPNLFVPVFLTSEEMGRLLSDINWHRVEIREAYSNLRMVVRYADDDALLNDQGIQAFFMTVFDMLANSYVNLLKDAVRPGIVSGIEFTCWAAYLHHHGALYVKDGISTQVSQSSVCKHEIVNDVLVLKEVSGSDASSEYITTRSITVTGDRYYGINIMTEYLADYLYKTFARAYLKVYGGKLIPFEYKEEDYTSVLQMPERILGGFVENTTRTQLIGELKIIVILVFRHFLNARSDLQALPFFGDDMLTLGDAFPGFSGAAAPFEITEEEIATSRAAALEALSSTIRQTGYAVQNYVQQSKALLEIRFNDLMGLVDDYQIQRDLEMIDPEEERKLLDEIKAKKESLMTLYDQVMKDLRASEEHAPLATELEAGYGPLIESLRNLPESNLVKEEVEWQIYESVVHPKSP